MTPGVVSHDPGILSFVAGYVDSLLLWTIPHFCLPQFVDNIPIVDALPSCVTCFNDSTACLIPGRIILFFWKASKSKIAETWDSLRFSRCLINIEYETMYPSFDTPTTCPSCPACPALFLSRMAIFRSLPEPGKLLSKSLQKC